MKKRTVGLRLTVGFGLGGVLLLAGICILAARFGHFTLNLPVEHKLAFQADASSVPSQLHADGNQLVDAAGRPVILRGLMAPDPSRLREKGRF